MNTQEGVKRIAIAIRVIGGIAALIFMGLAMTSAVVNGKEGLPLFLALAGVSIASLVAGFGLAWIIEGFASPKNP